MRRRVGAVAVVAAGLLATHGSVQARHDRPYPPAPACIQGWDIGVGGAFVDSSFGNAMVGSPCRFEATEPGGYRVIAGGRWQLRIERPDGTYRFFSSGAGSPTCLDDVIGRGDRVAAGADVAMVAGAGAGC